MKSSRHQQAASSATVCSFPPPYRFPQPRSHGKHIRSTVYVQARPGSRRAGRERAPNRPPRPPRSPRRFAFSPLYRLSDALDTTLIRLIIAGTGPKEDELLRQQEQAIIKLAELYRDQRDARALADILTQSRHLVVNLAKAKTAKLSQSPAPPSDRAPRTDAKVAPSFAVRTLLDLFAGIPDSTALQIDATKESAEWAKNDKRIFLKQNLETRLVALYVLSFLIPLRQERAHTAAPTGTLTTKTTRMP